MRRKRRIWVFFFWILSPYLSWCQHQIPRSWVAWVCNGFLSAVSFLPNRLNRLLVDWFLSWLMLFTYSSYFQQTSIRYRVSYKLIPTNPQTSNSILIPEKKKKKTNKQTKTSLVNLANQLSLVIFSHFQHGYMVLYFCHFGALWSSGPPALFTPWMNSGSFGIWCTALGG